MGSRQSDLLQGTLDLLILKTLALEPRHGWGIAKRIQQLSSDVLQVQQGSLYPALYRLQDRGLLRSSAAESEEGRQVRVYRLTAKGRKELERQSESWEALSAAVDRVLAAEPVAS